MKQKFLILAVLTTFVLTSCGRGTATFGTNAAKIAFAETIPITQPVTDSYNSDIGFSDVAADAWYAQAVIYCRDNEIISGTSNAAFSPEMTLSRAMLVTILWRIDGKPDADATESFTDAASGQWYSEAVAWAVSAGIVSGYNSQTFGTNDPVTREQAAALIYRYAEYKGIDTKVTTQSDFADARNISSWAAVAVTWAKENEIIAGWQGNGFAPQSNATRAEAAYAVYRYLKIPEHGLSLSAVSTSAQEGATGKMKITVGEYSFAATFEDNSSAEALRELLAKGSVTIDMSDYGGFEKVGFLGMSIPKNDEQITTGLGDIILYQGNQITIYYAQNSWSFTRLGKIDDTSLLREALGGGDVTVTFSLE